MKNFLLLISLIFVCWSIGAQSDLIWTEPTFPTIDDEVTIYYDASQGNGELSGFAEDVYAHTGVITTESSQPNDWKYVVGNWGQADDRVLMTRVDDDLYSITYTISDFYDLDPGVEVLELAFVFRSVDGSLVGRDQDGGDIFTPVFSSEDNIFVTRQSPGDFELIFEGDSLHFDLQLNQVLNIKIYDNDDLIIDALGDELNYKYVPTGQGDHQVRYEYRSEEDSLFQQSAFFVIDTNQVEEDPAVPIKNGTTVIGDEVYFQLHAPNKKYCFLLNELNNYTIDESFRMKRREDGERFWISIPLSQLGGSTSTYQYYVDGDVKIADPYAAIVLDPWNDWAVDLDGFEDFPEYPEEMTSGIVTVLDTREQDYPWMLETFQGVENEDLIIYETLMRDFLEDHSYESLEDTLTYLKRLGINAIQLMPVSEFEGNNSWGYNPSFHMALDKYYGSPDAFRSFVDAAHQAGIAVILDVVYNHVFSQSPLAQLYWDQTNFRPSSDNPWLNVIAKHPFNVGYDVNHEYEGTKEWVKQTLTYWMEEYKIDGFRFDLSKGFTQRNSGSNSALMAQYDQGRIDILKEYADHVWSHNEHAYVIMEHFADNVEERELASYGMMLWANESHQFAEAAMGYNSNLRSSDYTWRNFDQPNLIAYMESHDEERMAYKLLNFGNQNGSYDTRTEPVLFRRIEAATALYFSIPGPKMLWKFGELAYDYSINRCEDGSISNDCRLADKPITWEYQENAGRARLFDVNRAMAYLKDELKLFKSDDFQLDDGDNFVKSIVINNEDNSVLTIVNFNVEQEEITIEFPFAGEWYEYFSQTSVNVGENGLDVKMAPGEYRIFSVNELDLPIEPIFGSINLVNQNNEFTISPNPVSSGGMVKISGLSDSTEFDVLDPIGRLVYSGVLTNGIFELPEELKQGLYFFQTKEESQIGPISLMVVTN